MCQGRATDSKPHSLNISDNRLKGKAYQGHSAIDIIDTNVSLYPAHVPTLECLDIAFFLYHDRTISHTHFRTYHHGCFLAIRMVDKSASNPTVCLPRRKNKRLEGIHSCHSPSAYPPPTHHPSVPPKDHGNENGSKEHKKKGLRSHLHLWEGVLYFPQFPHLCPSRHFAHRRAKGTFDNNGAFFSCFSFPFLDPTELNFCARIDPLCSPPFFPSNKHIHDQPSASHLFLLFAAHSRESSKYLNYFLFNMLLQPHAPSGDLLHTSRCTVAQLSFPSIISNCELVSFGYFLPPLVATTQPYFNQALFVFVYIQSVPNNILCCCLLSAVGELLWPQWPDSPTSTT